jgi:hypothetical protein
MKFAAPAFALVISACLTTWPAFGQSYGAGANFGINFSSLHMHNLNSSLNENIGEQVSDQRLSRDVGRSMLSSGATELKFDSRFIPSVPRRKANLASFVAKSRASDPAGSAQMAQLFASTDPIVALGRDLQPYGLRTDNVADAYTVYWVQAWQAANGDTSDPSRATMQAVKRQSASALAATSEFGAATDATKQEMAEAMMVQAMLISASVDVYKDDPNMMRQLGAAVRKGAKASGLDLDAMTLTDEGFVPARKTGAVAGKGDTRLADADTGNAPVTNDNSPPYLLMAAAGGVGVGGVFLIGKAMGRRG